MTQERIIKISDIKNFLIFVLFEQRNGLISNNQLVKISDWVYCGNLNSVKNERALCHLGIEYVIDMSNLRPDDLSRAQTLGRLPCTCKRQQHSRFYLTIELRETSFKVSASRLPIHLFSFVYFYFYVSALSLTSFGLVTFIRIFKYIDV